MAPSSRGRHILQTTSEKIGFLQKLSGYGYSERSTPQERSDDLSLPKLLPELRGFFLSGEVLEDARPFTFQYRYR